MAGISLELANFFALVFETLLYGAFCVLFGIAVWVITRKKKSINVLLLTTASLMWVLSTAHWGIDVARAMQALIDLQGGSAQAYYSNLSDSLQVAKTAVYINVTMVGDAFMIYRCYIIWGRWWPIIILPIMLFIGTGVTGYGTLVSFLHTTPGSAIFRSSIKPWITSYISMTLSTNVVSTIFIAFRILAIQRAVRHLGQTSRAVDALVLIVESASIYSSTLVALISMYIAGSNGQYIALDMTSPLIGIAFTVIILRVSLGLTTQEITVSTRRAGPSNSTRGYPMVQRPVAVNVSQWVETERYDSCHSANPTKPEDWTMDAASSL